MSQNSQTAAAPRGFVSFRVVEKRTESAAITSFVLAAADGSPRRPFRPGQFVIVRLPDANGGTLLRNYSLSGDARDPARLRISVKREPAPADRPELPPGQGSNYLHDCVEVGDLLELAGPAGEFVLDENSARPVLLLSGGVGLTPMLSMLHRLSRDSTRPVYFVHACENGAAHAFRDEVLTLAAARPGITVHFCYRNPSADDLAGQACHSQGLISRETLQALLPLDDYDAYLCGPRPFMQANWRLLRSLGIARERIHYEFFGPATILDEDEATIPKPAGYKVATLNDVAKEDRLIVSFEASGVQATWEPSCHSLLELAEQAGLTVPFNCRAGLCNTCLTPLLQGEVEYAEPPLEQPGDGEVLMCCARPQTPVTLRL